MRWILREKITETPETVTLRFAPQEPVSFNPGQYFLFFDMIKGLEECRAYSASSSPLRPYVDITVKLVPNACFSKHLHNLRLGTDLEVKGPFGDFFLDTSIDGSLLLIGAGSGIAPLRSIVQHSMDTHSARDITLVYSSKTADQVIFLKEFQDLDSSDCLDFKPTLTQERKKMFRHGRIDESLLRDSLKKNTHVFVCGPPLMAKSTAKLLEALRVAPQRIHMEQF